MIPGMKPDLWQGGAIAVWLLACLLPAASAIVLHREYPVPANPPAQS